MDGRLLRAALWRRRGSVMLAVAAVAIGASVAAALLHVSRDVSRQLTRELRSLGPNLLVVPDEAGGGRFVDVGDGLRRAARAGVAAVPVLYVSARTVAGAPVTLAGAPLDHARRLHPAWTLTPGARTTLLGARAAARLGLGPGDTVTVTGPAGAATLAVGAVLTAGGADDEAWWIPLERAQALAALPDRASLLQSRVVDADAARAAAVAFEHGGGLRALPLHALSATEAVLHARLERLMLLVTAAALAAAGLCAFGTLTDLALERRREIALMKALGATRRHVVRQIAAESIAIGLAGGVLGWAVGAAAAQVIGRQVFQSAIALHPLVPLVVIGLSVVVAAVAGLGPMRLALAVEPAAALKGE